MNVRRTTEVVARIQNATTRMAAISVPAWMGMSIIIRGASTSTQRLDSAVVGEYLCLLWKCVCRQVVAQPNLTHIHSLDRNECTDDKTICGQGGTCNNLIGSYNCTCHAGYVSRGKSCEGEWCLLWFYGFLCSVCSTKCGLLWFCSLRLGRGERQPGEACDDLSVRERLSSASPEVKRFPSRQDVCFLCWTWRSSLTFTHI